MLVRVSAQIINNSRTAVPHTRYSAGTSVVGVDARCPVQYMVLDKRFLLLLLLFIAHSTNPSTDPNMDSPAVQFHRTRRNSECATTTRTKGYFRLGSQRNFIIGTRLYGRLRTMGFGRSNNHERESRRDRFNFCCPHGFGRVGGVVWTWWWWWW